MVVLSRGLEERLRREAEKLNISMEELVVDILLKALNISLDLNDKVEFHLKLSEKFLREAEEFLARGDYVQASEKGWGAAAQIVKALAIKEGRELRSHHDLWEYVSDLADKLQDYELRYLWGRANNLHQNFYEGWMPSKEVRLAVGDVKKFIEKLRKFL